MLFNIWGVGKTGSFKELRVRGGGSPVLKNKWSSGEIKWSIGDALTPCQELCLAGITGTHKAQTQRAGFTDINPVLRIGLREGQ